MLQLRCEQENAERRGIALPNCSAEDDDACLVHFGCARCALRLLPKQAVLCNVDTITRRLNNCKHRLRKMRKEDILAGGLRGENTMPSAMLRNQADNAVRDLILNVVHRNRGISLADLQDAFENYIPAETLEWKTFEMRENLFLTEQDGQLHVRDGVGPRR